MKNKSGQVLLITVMLLATVLTATLAVTFRSTTETQVTKLQEDSQKALAAAEAGVEAALKQNVNSAPLTLNISGFTGSASVGAIPPNGNTTQFVTPLLQKDQQYTFYLTDYINNVFNITYWSGFLDIYFKSESGSNVSLEITLIDNNNVLTRYVIDQAAIISSSNPNFYTNTGSPWDFGGYRFNYKTYFPGPPPNKFNLNNYKLMIVRILQGSTRLAFVGTTNLKPQGKYVTSTATSTAGVSKTVTLFQSYPQIPAEFFVTSF